MYSPKPDLSSRLNSNYDRKQYWERKILSWEYSRYGGSAWLRPGSWTLRRRMRVSARLAKGVLSGCAGGKGSVLELGCGSGLLAEKLRGELTTYLGIDLADSAIKEARERVRDPRVSFEQGDVLRRELPRAELTVFLGLLDWLEPSEIEAFFARLRSTYLLFSYTEEATGRSLNPYSLYRSYYDSRFGGGVYKARSYRWSQVESWLKPLRVKKIELQPSSFLDPGRLVLVECEGSGV
jgi:SAM-dependent methyltransferase